MPYLLPSNMGCKCGKNGYNESQPPSLLLLQILAVVITKIHLLPFHIPHKCKENGHNESQSHQHSYQSEANENNGTSI